VAPSPVRRWFEFLAGNAAAAALLVYGIRRWSPLTGFASWNGPSDAFLATLDYGAAVALCALGIRRLVGRGRSKDPVTIGEATAAVLAGFGGLFCASLFIGAFGGLMRAVLDLRPAP
jgi:hypothetical protein